MSSTESVDPIAVLLCRVQSGDEMACEEVINRYGRYLRGVIRRKLRNHKIRRLIDSLDIYQSVFMEFFVALNRRHVRIESDSELKRILATIARNNFIKQAEKHEALKRDVRRTVSISPEHPSCDPRESNPAKMVPRRDLLKLILSRLSDDERHLIDQRSQGRSWGDIAADVGCTADALRMRLRRARSRIKQELNLDGQDVA